VYNLFPLPVEKLELAGTGFASKNNPQGKGRDSMENPAQH
jgi:hypothetical protein